MNRFHHEGSCRRTENQPSLKRLADDEIPVAFLPDEHSVLPPGSQWRRAVPISSSNGAAGMPPHERGSRTQPIPRVPPPPGLPRPAVGAGPQPPLAWKRSVLPPEDSHADAEESTEPPHAKPVDTVSLDAPVELSVEAEPEIQPEDLAAAGVVEEINPICAAVTEPWVPSFRDKEALGLLIGLEEEPSARAVPAGGRRSGKRKASWWRAGWLAVALLATAYALSSSPGRIPALQESVDRAKVFVSAELRELEPAVRREIVTFVRKTFLEAKRIAADLGKTQGGEMARANTGAKSKDRRER